LLTKKIWQKIKDIWNDPSWNEIPKCRVCKGTGLPSPKYNYGTQVYWQGNMVNVCHNCDGTGVK
jgi:hypothetical protein